MNDGFAHNIVGGISRLAVVGSILISEAVVSNCGTSQPQLPPPALSMSPPSLWNLDVGTSNELPLAANSGVGPHNWSVNTGTVTHNISLVPNGDKAMISKSPDTQEKANLMIQFTDSVQKSAIQPYTVDNPIRPRSTSITFTEGTPTSPQSAGVTGAGMLSADLCGPALDKQVIPVKLVDGMVFVPVNVNGSDLVLMLDTGATNIVISPAAVHMPVFAGSQTATVTEGHQQVSVGVARLDVRVGKAQFESSVVVLTDLAAAQRTRYGQFDGLLGQSILSQFKSVCLDYQNRVLELKR